MHHTAQPELQHIVPDHARFLHIGDAAVVPPATISIAPTTPAEAFSMHNNVRNTMAKSTITQQKRNHRNLFKVHVKRHPMSGCDRLNSVPDYKHC